MKVGIIGLPQTGKKTLFQVLTSNRLPEHAVLTKPVPGTADILDGRFDKLVEMYEPKKETRARIDLVLLPKMEQENIAKGNPEQEGRRETANEDARVPHLAPERMVDLSPELKGNPP